MLDALYGGTHAFVTDNFDRLNIGYTFTATEAATVIEAVTPATRVIVIESPTQPPVGRDRYP